VFRAKRCRVVSVSGGALGGVRAQAHLKYILNGMLAVVHPCQEMVVPQAGAKVEGGRFTDKTVLDFVMANVRDFLSATGS
jgi:chromate reductase